MCKKRFLYNNVKLTRAIPERKRFFLRKDTTHFLRRLPINNFTGKILFILGTDGKMKKKSPAEEICR